MRTGENTVCGMRKSIQANNPRHSVQIVVMEYQILVVSLTRASGPAENTRKRLERDEKQTMLQQTEIAVHRHQQHQQLAQRVVCTPSVNPANAKTRVGSKVHSDK